MGAAVGSRLTKLAPQGEPTKFPQGFKGVSCKIDEGGQRSKPNF